MRKQVCSREQIKVTLLVTATDLNILDGLLCQPQSANS